MRLPHPAPLTLRRTLGHALLRVAGLGLLAAVVLVLAVGRQGPQDVTVDAAPAPAVVPLDEVNTQERGTLRVDPARLLVVEHGCWTGAAPADMTGRLPGHAVVTVLVEGRLVPQYVGGAWVSRALDKAFGATDDEIAAVHGFCR